MFVRAIGIRTTCVMTRLPVLLTDCGDGVMALGGPFLDQATINQVRSCISAGAQGN
jgi:hypothetical protein